MKDVPICLQRRYHALDDFFNDLNAEAVRAPMVEGCFCGCKTYHGIKRMCDVWNVVKEDPNFNPAQTQRMDPSKVESDLSTTLHLLSRPCHKGCRCPHKKGEGSSSAQKKSCCQKTDPDSVSVSSGVVGSLGTGCTTIGTDLKDNTNSFERVCTAKVDNLLQTEEQLKDALRKLEQREKKGTDLLKKADYMWVCMEDAYKKKLSESSERQMALERELKVLELSTKKWRKNMRDLEFELIKMDKIEQETKEKCIQKNSDIKCVDLEIADLKKRLEHSKTEVESTKKSYIRKKEASDKKIASLDTEVKKLEKSVAEENKKKRDKELEGTKFIKDAREDLQKISGVLLKKKLENEDMKAEKATLLSDIDMLVQVRDTCKDRCDLKQKSLEEDIKNIDEEIARNQNRCIKCNKCTDTSEFHRFCTDCPQCVEERRCFIEGDHCGAGPAMDCVCVAMKKKFLDNVFENMYTVLERLIYKGRGKMVADQVLDCLQRSRNGKLDEKTRKSLQAFILSGVKRHLNLTIVGGAVKTRCEMEPETYKKLMDCLQKVKVTTIPKVDKGTISKKEPCTRWGGTNECHCPKGPKGCICTRKAPLPPTDPTSCPEEDEDEQDKENGMDSCPHGQNLICDCEKPQPTLNVDEELSGFKPEPCKGSTCQFSKNMRTAPCDVQYDESSVAKHKDCCTSIPIKIVPSLKDQDFCDCTLPTGSSYDGTNVINLNTHINKLIKSPSGTLVIQFKDDFLKSIQKEINMNPLSKIIIKDIKSGRLSIQLTADKKEFDVDKTMVLNNFSSGCVCFKGNDSILKLINEAAIDVSQDNKYFCSQCDKMQSNAVLRETPSGVVLVIPTEPLKLVKNRLLAFNRSPETYSKVKVLYLDDTVIQFPGVLKSTSSHNYILIVDKEFDKNFRETVNNFIRDDSAITATIRKSISDCYLVKLGCPDITSDTNIAILKKTRSGNIKVIVNDSNSSKLRATLRCQSAEVVNLSKYCLDLLKKLNNRNTYHITICQEPYKRYEHFDYNEISNTTENSLEDRIYFNSSIVEESSVPLNEKSRSMFIDILKKYITDPSKTFHLTKTISDSSILVIKRGFSKNSLIMKITPSRNMYVLPNQKSDRQNNVQRSPINLVYDDVIENTATNNKLVGSYISLTSQDTLAKLKSFSESSKVDCNTGKHIITEEKSVPEIYTKSLQTNSTDSTESAKIMQYIVIKPTPKLSCIYHTDMCNASSLDDLPCSGFSEKNQGKTINTGENSSAWDSLSFLPPQLPLFLGDVKHLYN